jgi:outer membrane protein insertion porin family
MIKKYIHFWVFFSVLVLGCNTIKRLPKGDVLYSGAKIQIDAETPANKSAVKKEVEQLKGPRPNSSFLRIRSKLWIYQVAGKGKEKGLGHYLKTKLGEAPVLISAQQPEKTAGLMKNHLNAMGYFHSHIDFERTKQKNTAGIIYTITLNQPYLIHTVVFPTGDSILNKCIRAGKSKTLLKTGVHYNLDLFKQERLRIDKELKDSGFFYFNAEYLLFKADSNNKDKQVNITLSVKALTPAKARQAYMINTVSIHIEKPDSMNSDSTFRPAALLKSVFLKKGDLYSRTKHNQTLTHLMEMGTFKFADIKFNEDPDSAGKLDVMIRLSPLPRNSVSAEMDAITKSNDFTGPALTLSYKDRNLFNGAELFVFNVLGSFETQFGVNQGVYNSYEMGANTQLYFPEFIIPFNIKPPPTLFLAKTKIDLGFKMLQSVFYYNMSAMNLSFGYIWKASAQKSFELDPISFSFTKLLSTTQAFNSLLLENPYLFQSFEEQFIIGSTLSYTYNSMIGSKSPSQDYFNGTIQVSGNTLHLAQTLLSGPAANESSTDKVFGYDYAQYSRITLEYRYYYNLNKNNKIAIRFYGGVGLPYGNSSIMPYVKQFFSGGSNSIRAFQARSLGPGSYKIPDSLAGKFFFDQSGDIKLEGNLEYRFNIISVLKGAVFTDAGNIWLAGKNPLYPGGEFNIATFQNEMAVGTGAGLRFDFSYFVIRFDLAFPLRIPSLPENERWVVSQIDFNSSSWRNQNLVLNLAIGYPF